MDALAQRIVEAAMELAERDGYDAVRLRELATNADVALGTVYRRFRSKEDILAAALELQADRLEERLRSRPLREPSAEARLHAFFRLATQGLVRRPKLARALLRAVASGDPELAQKVIRFHGQMTGMILTALHGGSEAEPTPREATTAHLLQQLWFTALVGWAGGLFGAEQIAEQVRVAVRVVLRGVSALEDE